MELSDELLIRFLNGIQRVLLSSGAERHAFGLDLIDLRQLIRRGDGIQQLIGELLNSIATPDQLAQIQSGQLRSTYLNRILLNSVQKSSSEAQKFPPVTNRIAYLYSMRLMKELLAVCPAYSRIHEMCVTAAAQKLQTSGRVVSRSGRSAAVTTKQTGLNCSTPHFDNRSGLLGYRSCASAGPGGALVKSTIKADGAQAAEQDLVTTIQALAACWISIPWCCNFLRSFPPPSQRRVSSVESINGEICLSASAACTGSLRAGEMLEEWASLPGPLVAWPLAAVETSNRPRRSTIQARRTR